MNTSTRSIKICGKSSCRVRRMERGSRMSSATVSPRGFVAVRGRGYRPDQVDAYAAAISQYRDAAWERAARLTVLAKDMEAEAGRMRVAVSRLAPQTYEALGERAQRLFQLGVEEAAALRESARRAAEDEVAQAVACASGVLQGAREYADALRAEADERARQRLLAARAEADDIRIGARREVKEGRTEALSALREVRQRTAGLLGSRPRSMRSGGRWPSGRLRCGRLRWMRSMPSGSLLRRPRWGGSTGFCRSRVV